MSEPGGKAVPDRFDAMAGNGHRHPSVPVDAAFSVDHVHRLRFTRDALDAGNPVLRDVLCRGADTGGRLIAFIDEGVDRAWPDLAADLRDYLADNVPWLRLAGPVGIVPGGEAAKNDWSVYQTVARAVHDAKICRHSYVMVIGGGAVLDAVGFAAATAHRGVRLVRLPTTSLAQADSGIGVKNGINAFGKKNFLGVFDVPWAVVNDERFLATLSDRDWRCGLSEAVKVALLKDARLLDLIETNADRLGNRDDAAILPVVRRSAELHLQHIVTSGDPFELRGVRPLDFGHWSAHKLEAMTGFEVRHGEAVASGVAIDVLYSAMIGRLPASEKPQRQSRWDNVASSSKSLITAHGGANVPRKFFRPKALMPFLTPTPESACPSVVVGNRTRRIPRCAMAAAKPTASSTAPPPITVTVECRQSRASWIRVTTRSATDRSFLAASPPGTITGIPASVIRSACVAAYC